MDRATEGFERTIVSPGRQSGQCFRLGRPGVYVVDHVPVPRTHAGGFEREAIALLTDQQSCLGLLPSDELFFRSQTRPSPADALLERVLHARSLRAVEP